MKQIAPPRWLMLALCALMTVLGSLPFAIGQDKTMPHPPSEIILMPGRIIAPPELATPIVLKDYNVQVAIKDNVSTTTISQRFYNNSQRTLEAKYLYPLPPEANFSSFTLTINGKAVAGKIMEKEEARNTYYNIVRQYIDPGLLEFVDDKTVQASIAPIFPGEEKRIQLSYTQLLKQDGGLSKYQYPFGFSSNQAMPQDESSLGVTLNTSEALKTVYSPSHAPKVERNGNTEAKITLNLKDPKVLQEKSFVLYFSQDSKAISLNSLAFKESPDGNGYFLVTIRTPKDLDARKVLPKNVMLAIDTSGSMSGDKIVQAKEALKYIINHLRPDDRFNILQFNTDVSLFRNELMSVNEDTKKAGLAYVEGLQADGSTHIEGALKTAFQQLPKSIGERPAYVIFLTDGEPTVGITDTDGLLKVANDANTSDAKLFNFGVGYDVKTDLLGKLASAHHGSTTYVEPNENLELALTGFYNKIEAPVLADAKVDFGSFKVSKVYPAEIGDLFMGSDVVLLGRFEGGSSGMLTLTGKVGTETRRFQYPVAWEGIKTSEHNQLPRLWAGRRIGYLLDNIHQNGENKEVKDEVVALSKQFGIITPYTSYLAMEPEGVKPGFGGAMPDAPAMSSMDGYLKTSGRQAVKLQKSLGRMKQQASAAEMNEAQTAGAGNTALTIQAIGEKTFVLSKAGVWTDTAYMESQHGRPVNVIFGTLEYFQLLTQHPELTPYFSLGQQVLVLLDGKAYQVTAPKAS